MTFPRENKKEIDLLVLYKGERDLKMQSENNRACFVACGLQRIFLPKVEATLRV